MAHELDDRPLPRPVLARRLAARIGRSFSEVIALLCRLGDDADAVVRHFHDEDAEEERKAARCRRRQGEAPALEPFAAEPIVICKSEGGFDGVARWPDVDAIAWTPVIAYTPCLAPDNAAVIDEMVSRGVLARATIVTARGGRAVYASPSFASYLRAGEE
jgi:hypothetical protein